MELLIIEPDAADRSKKRLTAQHRPVIDFNKWQAALGILGINKLGRMLGRTCSAGLRLDKFEHGHGREHKHRFPEFLLGARC